MAGCSGGANSSSGRSISIIYPGVPQYINGAWFGWHAFCRLLGTRLNEMDVDDKEIPSILRYADISTRQAYYILPSVERGKAALKRLGAVAQKKYGIKV
jgi:hypothetical protein